MHAYIKRIRDERQALAIASPNAGANYCTLGRRVWGDMQLVWPPGGHPDTADLCSGTNPPRSASPRPRMCPGLMRSLRDPRPSAAGAAARAPRSPSDQLANWFSAPLRPPSLAAGVTRSAAAASTPPPRPSQHVTLNNHGEAVWPEYSCDGRPPLTSLYCKLQCYQLRNGVCTCPADAGAWPGVLYRSTARGPPGPGAVARRRGTRASEKGY